jgi:hypothetical protein
MKRIFFLFSFLAASICIKIPCAMSDSTMNSIILRSILTEQGPVEQTIRIIHHPEIADDYDPKGTIKPQEPDEEWVDFELNGYEFAKGKRRAETLVPNYEQRKPISIPPQETKTK